MTESSTQGWTAESRQRLWDPEMQGRDEAAVAAEAGAALREEWARAWELAATFHRDRFESVGLSSGEMPPLDEIPRTNKAAMRADEAANPPFGRHRAVALDDAVRMGSSTGTTGTPTLIFYGPTDVAVSLEVATRNLWRHGLRSGGRFTHCWPQGVYPTNVTGGRSYLTVGALEIAVGPPFSVEMAAEHVRLWQLLRPTAFMMTSAQLHTYEEAASAEGIQLADLMEGGILVFLEASCQFDVPRRRVETAYGVQLRNIGGASEMPGFATSDCAFHTGLHVAADHFVVQACDPVTGREVPDGERGSLVVSAFGLEAHFLRYDLEDIVTVTHGKCECGETGPRYTLLGRGADAISVAGRTLLPLDVQLALEDHGAPEFQLVDDPEGGAVRARVERPSDDGEELASALSAALDVAVEVEAVAMGTLPRSTFKARRRA